MELVKYPALKSHPQYELCKTQMNGLGGGVVSFKLKDGINAYYFHLLLVLHSYLYVQLLQGTQKHLY
ncbi:PLP-dependent transferase [Clostridioides difficile]